MRLAEPSCIPARDKPRGVLAPDFKSCSVCRFPKVAPKVYKKDSKGPSETRLRPEGTRCLVIKDKPGRLGRCEKRN